MSKNLNTNLHNFSSLTWLKNNNICAINGKLFYCNRRRCQQQLNLKLNLKYLLMNIISCIALSNTCSKQSDWQLKIFQPITELKTSVGSGPGLVALGGDLLLRGIEFKSQPQKLDELLAEKLCYCLHRIVIVPRSAEFTDILFWNFASKIYCSKFS